MAGEALWIRVETFGLHSPTRGGQTTRWNARQVIYEAAREPGHCPHVPEPREPDVLHGVPPRDVLDYADHLHAEARDPLGRRARRDAQVLMSVVASCPVEDTDPRAQDWERRTLDWMRARWGRCLESVVRHLDEGRRHLHGLILPPLVAGRIAMAAVHPGVAARDAVRAAGGKGRDAHAAFKRGLREIADDLWTHAGAPLGFARVGGRRQRLSRSEWMSRKAEAARLADAWARVERRERAVEQADAWHLIQSAADLRRALEEARKAKEKAEERAAAAERDAAAGREALALLRRASEEADRIEAMGGWRTSRTPAEREARVIDRMRAIAFPR